MAESEAFPSGMESWVSDRVYGYLPCLDKLGMYKKGLQ